MNEFEYEIRIFITNESLKNKGIASVSLNKFMDICKNKFHIKALYAKIKIKDEKSIHLFSKAEFKYLKEDLDFVYMVKKF